MTDHDAARLAEIRSHGLPMAECRCNECTLLRLLDASEAKRDEARQGEKTADEVGRSLVAGFYRQKERAEAAERERDAALVKAKMEQDAADRFSKRIQVHLQTIATLTGERDALRKALKEVSEGKSSDGQECWCDGGPRNAVSHSSYCLEARAALAPRPPAQEE